MGRSKKRYSTRASRSQNTRFSLPLVSMVAVGAVMLAALAIFFISRRGDEDSGAAPTRTFAPAFTPEVTGAPRIEVPEATINHGDVKLGQTVRSVFKVRNVGGQPLEILNQPLQVEVLQGC